MHLAVEGIAHGHPMARSGQLADMSPLAFELLMLEGLDPRQVELADGEIHAFAEALERALEREDVAPHEPSRCPRGEPDQWQQGGGHQHELPAEEEQNHE